MRYPEKRFLRTIRGLFFALISATAVVVLPGTASADLILNAEVGAVMEDNIVGLLTGNTNVSANGGSMAGASASHVLSDS